MRFRVQLRVTIDVEAEDGRDAVPVALGYFQEAMDWATEHQQGESIKGVEWRPEILSSLEQGE
jgi:hypothetical protein